VLFASRPEQSTLVGVDQVNENLRQFWRLRRHAEDERPTLADQYVAEPGVTPLDSIKTFVGPNGTYYDERWRFMEWRGRRRSWNWAAALSFGGWLAYRKMYASAILYLVWLGVLLGLAMNGVALWLLAPALLAAAVAIGNYGNALYLARFRRAALQAAQGDGQHEDRLAALACAGGTSRLAVGAMIAAGLGLTGFVIWSTRWMRDGIDLPY
jgi:Protein of unknown function (DUF2628)